MGRIILVISMLFSGALVAQDCSDLKWMIDFLRENHFQPVQPDSAFAVAAIEEFTDTFDPNSIYLDKTTIEALSERWGDLLSEIESGNCLFAPFFDETVLRRIEEVESRIAKDKFWEFRYDPTRVLNRRDRAENYYDIEENWRAQIQFNSLIGLSLKALNTDQWNQKFDSLKALEKEGLSCRFNSLKEQKPHKVLYQSILNQFDPYTDYFDEELMNDFNMSMSGDLAGLGFVAGRNVTDEFEIVDVFPKGPAETGGLKKGMKLIAIETVEKKYDLTCISEDKLNQTLFGNDNLDYNLTLQSGDSTFKAILYKQVLNTTESETRSYVLEGEVALGYLDIPSFYMNDEIKSIAVSDDVAKAIFRLRMEKIEGLILDFRGNGGGSFREAIELISLFIDEGPLFQLIDKRDTIVVKDPARGVTYSGPMIVMVDGESASASEIVAMVLKEQQRALIVGTRTFGKTTSQTITALRNENSEKFLKYTVSSIYSLKGESVHGLGLSPTINFPIALRYGSLEPPKYRPIISVQNSSKASHPIPGTLLQERSSKRFNTVNSLTQLRETVDVINEFLDDERQYTVSMDNVHKLGKTLRSISVEVPEVKAFSPRALHHPDAYNDLEGDLLLEEAYSIFMDWLKHLNE